MDKAEGGCRKYFALDLEYRGEGVYYTGLLDSGESGTVWHRLVTEGDGERKADTTVEVCAADSPCQVNGENTKRCCQVRFDNPQDALLFEVTGRYLWLRITVKRQIYREPVNEKIRIFFPKHTWLKYLPEIYEDDRNSASFLERYLGIFQSLYEDMTERIERIPSFLEPSEENRDMLYELAGWFAIERRELWNDRQLLYLVRNAWRMRGQRGTVSGMRELVKLYVGREPYIVEYHQIQPYFDTEKKERLLRGLYCAHSREFAVLIAEETAGEKNRFLGLKQLVDLAKPAHMESKIVVLTPYIFLDRHSYLGINSVLGQYRTCCLNGLCAIPFSVLRRG